jgi:protein-tyrosine phosphatase
MRSIFAITIALLSSTALHAVDKADVTRVDDANVLIAWEDKDKLDIYLVDQPDAPLSKAALVASDSGNGAVTIALPAAARKFIRIKDHGDKSIVTVAERILPLEQGSNFRDLGGYKGARGKAVRWGKIYRSGAMPMLSERDYSLLGSLNIKSIIDLRSTDERQVAPTQLDDRTGAMFLSNDYSLAPMMRDYGKKQDNFYAGMEKTLKPQLRQIFGRLLAAEGSTVYNCSAGQDRTGMTSALILSVLGVDRETILTDYHLSTPSRRLQWEMPDVKPEDYPGNMIVQYYAASAKNPEGRKAEPLYTKAGRSHLVEFFEYLDKEYGGVEGYLAKELQVGPKEIARLREIYLES